MKTVIVELKNIKALQILRGLEEVNLIKLLKVDEHKESLSKSLRGALSAKKADELNSQLDTMRSQWNRNI